MGEKIVYIIGASPELLTIDSSYFDNKITIGVNHTYLYKNDMDYYIAGHPTWPPIWEDFAYPKEYGVYHGIDIGPLTKSKAFPKRVIINETNIKKYWDDEDFLVGADMCGFSATHLAYKIGATDIVYVGFDGTGKHFFHDELYFDSLRQHLLHLINKREDTKEAEMVHDKLFVNIASLTKNMEADYPKHKDSWNLLFNHLRQLGISVSCSKKGTITHKAGADYTPLK